MNCGGALTHFSLLLSHTHKTQDDHDGKCFGPAGFSECGDATLWHIRRRPSHWTRKRGLLRKLLQIDESEEKDWGFALQLVDYTTTNNHNDNDSSSMSLRQSRDCLTRRQTTNKQRGGEVLGLGKCTSLQTAWSWRVSGEGILFHGVAGSKRRLHPSQCLWRQNTTIPTLSSCEADEEDSSSRLVRFSMVRYHSNKQSASTVERVLEEDMKKRKSKQHHVDEAVDVESNNDEITQQQHPVMSVDLAHSHATEPLTQPDVKPSSQLLLTPLSSMSSKERVTASMVPRNILKGASPILVAMDTTRNNNNMRNNNNEMPSSSTLTVDTTTTTRLGGGPVKLRKMPTHPYIASSRDNVWTDPQTGLEYITDLCEYLGHDRKESGRHTLTGVGQYTRTVFNIKVCVVCVLLLCALSVLLLLIFMCVCCCKNTILTYMFVSHVSLLFIGLRRGIVCFQTGRACRSTL